MAAELPGASTGRRVHPLAWFWIYTGMRLALLLVIFGLLWLFGLRGFVGAAVALLLTIPLSYVALARPRAAMVASMDRLRAQRRARTDAFDEQVGSQSAENASIRDSLAPAPADRPAQIDEPASASPSVVDETRPRPKRRT